MMVGAVFLTSILPMDNPPSPQVTLIVQTSCHIMLLSPNAEIIRQRTHLLGFKIYYCIYAEDVTPLAASTQTWSIERILRRQEATLTASLSWSISWGLAENSFRWYITYIPFLSPSFSIWLYFSSLTVYSVTGTSPNKTLAHLVLSWHLLIGGLRITVTAWLSGRKWACYQGLLMLTFTAILLVGLGSCRVAVIIISSHFCVTNYFSVCLPHVN